MKQQLIRPDRFFFGTRSLPCPYIAGNTERKVVTDLAGPNAANLYERLSRSGFRRSHGLAYRPACPNCNACVPVRINTGAFGMTRSFRRVTSVNADLDINETEAMASVEQYRLFSDYQRTRHEGGDMSGMAFNDYRAMIEDTPVASRTVEFRDPGGRLVAVMLLDQLEKSFSAVYSFFDNQLTRRSLGTYMILWMVLRARELTIPHVYLGYWIDGSDKMSYKARFRPLEGLDQNGWKILDV
ncbi:MAG: arginyltransferase [Pseudomonadota bacterium]|nr:arginyltransferase [Pseudomonadota bacterium]